MLLTGLTGCSPSEGPEDGRPEPELNIILAHNQTSLENPYSKAAIRFKEALEEVSGGRATATLHHGTLGENALHGATPEKRRQLMPVADKYHLEEVLEACDAYFRKTGRRVTFEYSLVAGVNDQPEDIRELTAILKER